MSTPMQPDMRQDAARIRDDLASGQPVHFQGDQSEAARRIPADWIREAIAKQVQVDLEHALIDGALGVRGADVREELSFVKCRFEDPANFSCVDCKCTVSFSGSIFARGANFQYGKFAYDLVMNEASFSAGEADFSDMHIHGVFWAKHLDLTGTGGRGQTVAAKFNRVRFESAARFWKAEFRGDVDFDHAYFGGAADFRGAAFRQLANFNPSIVKGGLFFRSAPELELPSAVFDGAANFGGMEIGDTADFEGVRFTSPDKLIEFGSIAIDGDALFNGVQFAGELSFFNATVSSNVDFTGARFDSEEKPVGFESAKIAGNVIFSGTRFAGAANFAWMDIGALAVFDDAEFSAPDKETRFHGTNIAGDAYFRGTKFSGLSDFSTIRIHGISVFSGATFGKKAIFSSANFDAFVNFSKDDKWSNAQFDDGIECIATHFGADASFRDVSFAGKLASFDGARIAGNALFERTRFSCDCSFIGIQVEGMGFFLGTKFSGRSDFSAIRIHGIASLSGATFGKKATFSSGNFEAFANFGEIDEWPNAQFADEIECIATRFNADVSFRGVSFGGKLASFDGARIAGNALFERTRFSCDCNFRGIQVGGVASFIGSKFEGVANFNSVSIGGVASFHHESDARPFAATFTGPTDFGTALFGSDVIFNRAQFTGPNGSTSFSGARVAGRAFFDETSFGAKAEFIGTRFGGDASFKKTLFLREVSFSVARFEGNAFFSGALFDTYDNPAAEADFRGVRFQHVADFQSAVFDREADFYVAQGLSLTRFENVQFRKHANFGGASFQIIHFTPMGRFGEADQFQSSVDLRGLTYERIQVHWRSLLQFIDGRSRLRPIDRQPFAQLEKVFRAAGEDSAADRIYLVRQRQERHQKWERIKENRGNFIYWLGSWIYGVVLNYGVKPVRLIVVSVVLIAIGMAVFHSAKTVLPKSNAPSQAVEVTQWSWKDGLDVSLHYFLPFEIPLGSQWVPSNLNTRPRIPWLEWTLPIEVRPSAFAAFLKVLGWLVVPLGAAAFTGIARTRT